MAFYYLLLGHLIGDFALQTDRIAENKGKHWEWNLLHVLVVTLSIFIFSYPFGILLNLFVLINGIIHFVLDYYKNGIYRLLRVTDLTGFLIDQSLHIMLLYCISLPAVYKNQRLIELSAAKFFIALMFVTFFSAVLIQFVLSSLFPGIKSKFFEEGERLVGFFTRIYNSIVLYLSFTQSPYYIFLLAVTAAMFFIQFWHGWNKWMSLPYLAVKLLLDIVIPAVCILFIFFS